jgi:hypothetical protein
VVTHKEFISNVNRKQENFTVMPGITDIKKVYIFYRIILCRKKHVMLFLKVSNAHVVSTEFFKLV